MTNAQRLAQVREQAIALRRAGKSRREIKEILQIRDNDVITNALRGEPPPAWTWRPNAKDDLRAKARELRAQGMAYNQIVAELGVSKSSVSLWVRDMPRPAQLSDEECRNRRAAGIAAFCASERALREATTDAIRQEARTSIGQLDNREILLAGAIPYWCEGTKSKPYRRDYRVSLINSDASLIKFFLHFLDCAGIPAEQLVFRVSIHESADVTAAQEFWLQVTGARPSQFHRPNLKRHNPPTTRMNTGSAYHGCLRIDVLRSARLYKQIEGWCDAVMASAVHPQMGVATPEGQSWLRGRRPGEPSERRILSSLAGLGLGIVRWHLATASIVRNAPAWGNWQPNRFWICLFWFESRRRNVRNVRNVPNIRFAAH